MIAIQGNELEMANEEGSHWLIRMPNMYAGPIARVGDLNHD